MAADPLVIITGTSNCADTIERFLEHHARLGVDAFFVTECGSVDGTRDVLDAARWRGTVFVIDRPSAVFSEFDQSTVMLHRATLEAGPGWTLFCDPDEFWQVPRQSFREYGDELDAAGANLVVAPRFNMTARRSAASSGAVAREPFAELRYRILRPTLRTPAEYGADRLVPPWIFTRIGDKVATRREVAETITGGDHDATLRVPVCRDESRRLCAAHVPIRGYESFAAKIRTARFDLAQDPTLHPEYAWHWRRWIRIEGTGRLYQEYLEQFIDDAEVDGLIGSGAIAVAGSLEEIFR